jgi:hypothetical protein
MTDTIDTLKDDDTVLRKILMEVLRHHHPDLAIKFEVIFAMSSKWCKSRNENDFHQLEQTLEDLNPAHSILVMLRLSRAHCLSCEQVEWLSFEIMSVFVS